MSAVIVGVDVEPDLPCGCADILDPAKFSGILGQICKPTRLFLSTIEEPYGRRTRTGLRASRFRHFVVHQCATCGATWAGRPEEALAIIAGGDAFTQAVNPTPPFTRPYTCGTAEWVKANDAYRAK
jgi:hypothetical protein